MWCYGSLGKKGIIFCRKDWGRFYGGKSSGIGFFNIRWWLGGF